MHEHKISRQIIAEAEKQGKVKKIVVEVGELGALSAEEVKEALKNAVKWKIVIKKKKATVKCGCGYEGRPSIIGRDHAQLVFECPKCRKVPQIIDGKEIILKKVVVE